MNAQLDRKMARALSLSMSTCFLFIHIVLLLMFFHFGVTPMVYFNVFSVVFYLLSFVLIIREHVVVYPVAVIAEVIAHMTLATVFVGWDSGFYLTLIGMVILGFFSEYVVRINYGKKVPSVALAICCLAAYVGACVFGYFNPPQYPLPSFVAFHLRIVWGVVTFIISSAALKFFVTVTFWSEQRLAEKADHDKLTGLPNRYNMSDYLNEQAAETGLDSHWIAIADIDNFKEINDTYGHICGDELLKVIADVLESSDMCTKVCRWGGEEFLLAGTIDSDMEAVRFDLDRLRAAISSHGIWHDEQRLYVTVTIGVAAHEPGDTIIEWINRADQRLYKGKQNGKNQVVL